MKIPVHAQWKTRGALIQIAALMFIQVYIFLPLLHKAIFLHDRVACYHDHRLCGCSPDRVANHTCCCALSGETVHSDEDDAGLPPCCARKYHVMKSAPVNSVLPRFVNAPPCGTHPQFIMAYLEDLKFVSGASSLPAPAFVSSANPPEVPKILQERSGEPPDPPPKLNSFTPLSS